MSMLAAEGFHAISIDQYVRFQAGDLTAVPDRPILITFDDGRIDSFTNGDPVLARYGMRATMFVITANASAAKPGYLGWPALRSMAANGRWDLQLHAHAGHVLIPTGPGGQTGPYYANLAYGTACGEVHGVQAPRDRRRPHRAPHDGGRDPRLPARRVRRPLQQLRPGPASTMRRSRPGRSAGCAARSRPCSSRTAASTTCPGTDRRALRRARFHDGRGAAPAARPDRSPERMAADPGRIRAAAAGGAKRAPRPPPDRDRAAAACRRRLAGDATAHAGHRHAVRVRVGKDGRLRDRRLRPRTRYVYRITAASPAGRRSPALRLSVRTR